MRRKGEVCCLSPFAGMKTRFKGFDLAELDCRLTSPLVEDADTYRRHVSCTTNNLEDSGVIVRNERYRRLFALESWIALCHLILEVPVAETYCAEQDAEEILSTFKMLASAQCRRIPKS